MAFKLSTNADAEIGEFKPVGTNVGIRWEKWLKRFQYFLKAYKIDDNCQKRNLLLHKSGPEVQEIFESLDDTGGDDDFDVAVEKLNSRFIPKKNVIYERSQFLRTKQNTGEPLVEYVGRLQTLVKTCSYDHPEEMIRDQIVDKCSNKKLRRRFLQEAQLTLEKVVEIGNIYEQSESQARNIEDSSSTTSQASSSHEETVNALHHNQQNKYNNKSGARPKQVFQPQTQEKPSSYYCSSVTCRRCGNQGHTSRNCKITQGKECRKCGKFGHFAKMCCTKTTRGSQSQRKPQGRPQQHKHVSKTYFVDTKTPDDIPGSHSDSSDDFVFALNSDTTSVTCHLNNTKVKFMVDSGASVNVVPLSIYHALGVKRPLQKYQSKVFPYGSKTPLEIKGQFGANISVGDKTIRENFLVLDGKHVSLLGHDTATKLGILKIQIINEVVDIKSSIVAKRPNLFQGVGKLKDFQLDLHIDTNVTPVAQGARRVPFGIRKQLDAKIDELLDLEIIEPVGGPTPWVSPLVIIPKKGGAEIRVCVDMRRANSAIERERHPLPTVDEMLYKMNGATVMSKLDLKWGYHQIELSEPSRYITTFSTHRGLFRYKRLLFGVNSASEIYQHIISQVISDCPGSQNLSDDIIVFGKSQEEHDTNLDKVLEKLEKCGLTLNANKCEFALDSLTFMGHNLSNLGVRPDKSKVQAIKNARPPDCVSELRSFLGLVNYCSKFIPNFSSLTDPLRRLIKKGSLWNWGEKENHAFQTLKNHLSDEVVLAYFDLNSETNLVVDSSPYALGAILCQKQKDGDFKPVAYASRSLTEVETRYSQTEKEALAVVWGCERFNLYLRGIHFNLITDHKALEVIFSNTGKPPPRIERWVMRLQAYSYSIQYKPGRSNIADPLSRLVSKTPEKSNKTNLTEEYIYYVANNCIPKSMTLNEIAEKTRYDPQLSELLDRIESGYFDKSDPFYAVRHELSVVNDIVLRGCRIVMPCDLRNKVLQLAHIGHQGIVRCKQLLREKVWWPQIDKDVEKFISECHACQLVGSPPVPEPIISTPLPQKPWHSIAIDICGPFPSGESIIALVDMYSRWPEVTFVKSTGVGNVIKWLKHIFCSHGIPEEIISDNGPQFVSHEFREFCQENDISHRKVCPYWPAANGEIERLNKTLLKAIRTTNVEQKSWKSEINDFLLAYRSTPHATTGVSPAEMLFNRKIRNKIPQSTQYSANKKGKIDKNVRIYDYRQKQKGKFYADKKRKAKLSNIKVGDSVLLSIRKQDKLSPKYEKHPYQVIGVNGNVLTLRLNGKIIKRNIGLVKLYRGKMPMNQKDHIDQGSVGREYDLDFSVGSDRTHEERNNSTPRDQTDPTEIMNGPRTVPSRNHRMPAKFKDFILLPK